MNEFISRVIGGLARLFQGSESKGSRRIIFSLAERMAPLPVHPYIYVGTYPPPPQNTHTPTAPETPNSSCPHLNICQGHTGGRKFLPYWNKSWLGIVCRKRSPAGLRTCQVCRGSILKCRPPLGSKNNTERQGLSLETEGPGD